MTHEPRSRQRARWTPEMEPDRRSLQTLFAFAYGMQVGRMRRIAVELQKLAQQAQLATMASGAAIAIAAQNQIECIARSGVAAPQLGSKPEATVGLSGECIRTGIPQFCADTETHPFVDRMHSRTFGVRSIVYVPLFRGVQPAGVIGVFSDKAGHFTQHDMRVLQLIGREVTKLLKWEPNSSPLFTPVSKSFTPPETAVITAAAAMPPIIPQADESVADVELAEAFAKPLEEAIEPAKNANVSEVHEATAIEHSEELLSAPIAAAEIVEPAEKDAEAVHVEEPLAAVPAEDIRQPFWPEPEEVEYSATVPSFLFSEENGVPKWVWSATAVLAIGIVLGVIWWMVPRWTSKETPGQLVYGPPQVTKDLGEQAQTPTGDLAAVGARPGLSEVPGATNAAKLPLPPSTFVRTVNTQIVGSHTFVSVHLSGPAQFQAHELTNPDRIYVDLHGVEVAPELKDARIAGVGPVADFRFSKSPDNVVRLVMVLDAPCTYLVSVTSDPYVIVFDVQPLRMPRPGAAKRPGGQPGL